jgi:hypothetical protein
VGGGKEEGGRRKEKERRHERVVWREVPAVKTFFPFP